MGTQLGKGIEVELLSPSGEPLLGLLDESLLHLFSPVDAVAGSSLVPKLPFFPGAEFLFLLLLLGVVGGDYESGSGDRRQGNGRGE